MLQEDLVRSERKSETIRSGMTACFVEYLKHDLLLGRTLATDRGFKERVREDMLVRLLDAFVWRNYGELALQFHRYRHDILFQTGKKLSSWDSHTYKA